MPELPEVETLCRQLNQILPGKKILRITVLDPLLGNVKSGKSHEIISFPGTAPPGSGLERIPELIGQKFLAIERRGKFIDMKFDSGKTATLHLRMTGQLLCLTEQQLPFPAHTRLAFHLDSCKLLLIDPRRFATFAVEPQPKSPPLLDDPLRAIPAGAFLEKAEKRQLPIKSFLLDQRTIAGIGNIYACEILFAAGIDPRRPANSLTKGEWEKLATATRTILEKAVECRGTTVSDWRDLFGKSGTNQNNLEVYSRAGMPCRRCGDAVIRIKQGGRGTWFCPNCQK